MVLTFWITTALTCLIMDFSVQQSDSDSTKINKVLFRKRGNVSILGIFNYHFEDECQHEADKGLEEIASAIWTVEALNKYQYLPGFTIGLSIFGICENSTDQKDSFQMVEYPGFNMDDDNFIGALTTPEFHEKFSRSKSFLYKNIVHMEHIMSTEMLIDTIIQLLINLHWMSVTTIACDSAETLKLFKEKASDEGITIHDEFLMGNRYSCKKLSGLTEPLVMVVIAAFCNITDFDKAHDKRMKLILTPTNYVFDVRFLDLPKDTIVLLPAMESKLTLSSYIKNTLRHKDVFNYKPPTRGPLFVGTAASILKLLKPTKELFEKHCRNADEDSKEPCVSATDFIIEILGNKTNFVSQKSMKISPDDLEETLKVLKIEPSTNDEMFLYVSSVLNGNVSDDFAIFQIFNLKTKRFQPVLIMINDNLLRSRKITTDSDYSDQNPVFTETRTFSLSRNPIINLLRKSTGHSGESFENITFSKNPFKKGCNSKGVQSNTCPDPVINYTAATPANGTTDNNREVVWRSLTWVSINTSLGFVGVTCTLSTMFFIISRLCKGDVLESSPYFMISLMISVVLTYISSMPFSVEFFSDSDFMCNYRKTGPSVVFAVIFSLLLSRSVVLAFSETANESNGYLQSILCFFMIAVQTSIILQKWLFEKEYYDLNCADIYDKYKIILSLGYNFLLLFLLACVSPFIVRLRRNYKEGLLFSISVLFITLVWSAWVSFYVLLPNEHKDAAIAIGLNSTASVILFCIFIPQTYFMATSFVQETALCSFSNIDRRILTDNSSFNFRSNQTLNESTFGTISYKNCEMGLSNPNFSTGRSNENSNPIRADNFARETIIDASPEGSPK